MVVVFIYKNILIFLITSLKFSNFNYAVIVKKMSQLRSHLDHRIFTTEIIADIAVCLPVVFPTLVS